MVGPRGEAPLVPLDFPPTLRSRFLPDGVMIPVSAVEGTCDVLDIDLNLRI